MNSDQLLDWFLIFSAAICWLLTVLFFYAGWRVVVRKPELPRASRMGVFTLDFIIVITLVWCGIGLWRSSTDHYVVPAITVVVLLYYVIRSRMTKRLFQLSQTQPYLEQGQWRATFELGPYAEMVDDDGYIQVNIRFTNGPLNLLYTVPVAKELKRETITVWMGQLGFGVYKIVYVDDHLTGWKYATKDIPINRLKPAVTILAHKLLEIGRQANREALAKIATSRQAQPS